MKNIYQQIALSGVVAVMMVLAPTAAFAESTTVAEQSSEDALRARIAELEQKVKDLQELARLWQKRAEALGSGDATNMHERKEAMQEKLFRRLLHVGMSGEDVRALQEALAREPGVYPEGLVTGYYGPLTEAALRRLKARHNLQEDGQLFGPKMQAFLNQWLRGEGVKTLPAPGQMLHSTARTMDPRIEELLKNIRAGKRGEELRKNWAGGDGVKKNTDRITTDDAKKGTPGADGEDGEDGADGDDA